MFVNGLNFYRSVAGNLSPPASDAGAGISAACAGIAEAEDSADKKANKAGKGTHKYGYDSLNRMTSSNIAGTTITYTYDTLGNLVLERTKNNVVDYQYNELNRLTKK